MKKIFMACAAALAMFIASCSSSTCYTCTSSTTAALYGPATVCDSKATFTAIPTGVIVPSTFTGANNDAVKTTLEQVGYKCVAK